MRAFFDLVEAGRLYLSASELVPLGRALLAALRADGVVRDEDPGMVDVSAPDLARLLRALHGARARGTPLPATLDGRPVVLGWILEAAGDRELVLLAQPGHGLAPALARTGPARVLVPTARALSPALRAAHAPGALVELEALEETLVLRGGSVARRGGPPLPKERMRRERARRGPTAEVVAPIPRVATPPPRFPGVGRWEDVRICLVDKNLVRVDVARRSYRCTPHDLGMAHPRSRKATRVWEALVELCEHKGVFKTRRFGGIDATKKLVSRLRARLREVFGLEPSPFYRYRNSHGWRVRFTARPDLPGEDEDDWKEELDRVLGDKSQGKSS
ncbi:MAG TPA: hypothetical protein VHS09_03630 [Polyangiaceae bacterium]|jgi:hypothetical protein|nr:hypothetical protein [Polyangiaceae bacterium]